VPKSVVAGDFAVQRYHGKPVLSWWQGVITNTGAVESGEDVIVDQHYRPIARLKGQGGWVITLHELVIQGDHAWVTANRNIPMNLSPYGGAYNGALIDSAIQEYSLKTGKLLRSWDARDHIPLSDSYASLPTNGFPWDAYHVNSIQVLGASVIASMRNTWAAYRINMQTGKIDWTLGGKHSSFRLGPGTEFEWQHDVELHRDSTLTMFDDHCCQITGGGTYVSPRRFSRALFLTLDQRARTAKFVADYNHGRTFNSQYMGNAQLLPNGSTVVGWGSQPFISAFDISGRPLLDARLPDPDISYRATIGQWDGQPLYAPAGAARRSSGGKTVVYASWNGATRVAGWRVLAGSQGSQLRPVASAVKSGFETAIPVGGGSYRSFRLEALDARGRAIGTSPTFSARGS
jgi:hypothetical protein